MYTHDELYTLNTHDNQMIAVVMGEWRRGNVRDEVLMGKKMGYLKVYKEEKPRVFCYLQSNNRMYKHSTCFKERLQSVRKSLNAIRTNV